MFIFKTVTMFGPLTCSIFTTTRKFFTILCSIAYFGHSMSGRQWLGTILVFIGLMLDNIYGKPLKKPEVARWWVRGLLVVLLLALFIFCSLFYFVKIDVCFFHFKKWLVHGHVTLFVRHCQGVVDYCQQCCNWAQELTGYTPDNIFGREGSASGAWGAVVSVL